jgi:DNA-binding MarR family transcriptional regulator
MSQAQEESGVESLSGLAAELRVLITKLRRRMREQADARDLTPSQVAVMHRLEQEGAATVSALARAEGVRPQSMGATVATLEAAGLVAGQPDPKDGRQVILSLTEVCRQWLSHNRAAREDWLTRSLQAKLSREEQAVLASGVELLKRLVDEGPAASRGTP